MIAALLCVCQLAAARGEILVRTPDQTAAVRVASTREASYVSWNQVRDALDGKVTALPNGRHQVQMSGVSFELAHGVPYARVHEEIIPLVAAPTFRGDSIRIPLQLIAQILPRFTSAVRYQVAGRTLSISGISNATPAAGDAPETVTPRTTASKTTTGSPSTPARRRVVIDAGHGGEDEGTSSKLKNGTRVTEKSITLPVALMVAEELRKKGIDVVLTRSRDTLIALHDRGKIANASQGTTFVSIHVNSVSSSRNIGARGVETYFLSVARTEDDRRVQALENASVRFEEKEKVSTRSNPMQFILTDMEQNDHLRESSAVAEHIQRAVAKGHPGGNRGVKQAEFAVLVGSFMPSVLVEIGFLSNTSEAAYLVNKNNQRKIAASIAQGLDSYFKAYDRRIIANGSGK